MFFVMSVRLSDHNFFPFRLDFLTIFARISYFKFLEFKEFKHGIIVKYSPALKTTNFQTITLLVVHLCLCKQLILP